MPSKIAFFIDGGFFIRRVQYYAKKYFPDHELTPRHVVDVIYNMVKSHKKAFNRNELYRIYYYDAPPFEGQMREPVPRKGEQNPSTRAFNRERSTLFQLGLHKELKEKRKLALRMGVLANNKQWMINTSSQKELLLGTKTVADLLPGDFYLDIKQKGVDTRIGIDITTLSLRGFADTIVLIAGDADFVPAAKLARTYGVDVILDPMHASTISKDLKAHVDGIKSCDLVAILKAILKVEPKTLPTWWKPNRDSANDGFVSDRGVV